MGIMGRKGYRHRGMYRVSYVRSGGVWQWRTDRWDSDTRGWNTGVWWADSERKAWIGAARDGHVRRVEAGTTRSCRARRQQRIRAALSDVVTELERYAARVHGYDPATGGPVWHINRDDLEARWLATPVEWRPKVANTLEESNFRVILRDLRRIDPDGVDVRYFSSWLTDYERIYVSRDCAPAILAVGRWLDALADYPIADEEDLSALEDEQEEALRDEEDDEDDEDEGGDDD